MFKRKFIVTCAGATAILIGSLIDSFAAFEKGYFAISLSALLAGYWIVEFIIDYMYYALVYEDDYKIFLAEKVNKTMLSMEDIKLKESYYLKEFKRTRIKGKFYGFTKIIFAMGLFIFLVVCMF